MFRDDKGREELSRSAPTVSVVMPLYNTRRYLARAVGSVVNQTHTVWELLIIDDCSSDGSCELACRFSLIDSRIRVISMLRKSGPAFARNLGIEEASGDFIAFLDSDDLWEESKLEKQVAFMDGRGVAFSYTDYSRISESGSIIKRKLVLPSSISYRDLLKENKIGCLTAVYDVRRVGKVFMPLLDKRQDYALWLKLLRQVGRAYKVDGTLAKYRVRSGSVSSSLFLNVKYNWRVFRHVENLSFLRSIYYLSWNMLNKVRS